jgi:hypothetical protein
MPPSSLEDCRCCFAAAAAAVDGVRHRHCIITLRVDAALRVRAAAATAITTTTITAAAAANYRFLSR